MSMRENNIWIEQTSDVADFRVCALIMAATNPWLALGMSLADCQAAFEGIHREVFVLRKEQRPAGFAIIQPLGSFKGYIQTLAVDEAFRGKGYGSYLLAFCEKRILQFSPNIFICVSTFNEGAQKLYTRFGFEKTGLLKDFMKTGFDEILMRKSAGAILEYHPD